VLQDGLTGRRRWSRIRHVEGEPRLNLRQRVMPAAGRRSGVDLVPDEFVNEENQEGRGGRCTG
jgi:hypothetical protein